MKKILYICGSLNQTKMMYKISQYFPDCENYFTPYYADGFIDLVRKTGALDFTILGGEFRKDAEKFLSSHNCKIDYQGKNNDYDLVFTCADLIVPKNIRNKKLVLVQEGMTDPENLIYHFVKALKLPRWLASTSAMGLSDAYDIFCVASEGYRELFIKKGVKPEKIKVTGIPNFDDCEKYLNNNFPYKNFVLVATSDSRETFKYENRKKFIQKALKISNGRKLIFKLHPNEKYERAVKEIEKFAPGSLVFWKEDIYPMIANCDVLITRFSSVVYLGLALGKEVYSEFDINELKKLLPIQNGGTSAKNIATEARKLINLEESNSFIGAQLQAQANY